MTPDNGDSTASTNRQTRLDIPRMNCPWAARRVADHLGGIDGVIETHLEARKTVVVTYDPTHISEAAITAAAESPESTASRNSSRTRSRHRSGGCQCRCGSGRR